MINYYNAANEKIEKWTNRILTFYMKTFVPVYCIPTMTASYYKYFILDSAAESFDIILPSSYVETIIAHYFHVTDWYSTAYVFCRIPYFNEKTPIGYLFFSLFNIALTYYDVTILLCILLVYFGFCVLLTTITDDFKRNLNEIGKKDRIKVNAKKTMTALIEIKKDICEMVQFHGNVKQLSRAKVFNVLGGTRILFILLYSIFLNQIGSSMFEYIQRDRRYSFYAHNLWFMCSSSSNTYCE